jgi:hypothetical protein
MFFARSSIFGSTAPYPAFRREPLAREPLARESLSRERLRVAFLDLFALPFFRVLM